MKLTLSVEILSGINWWVDASYTTHQDFKENTGAMMSFRKGAVVSFLRKHKINVHSPTESELVGSDNNIPMMWWYK